MGGSSFLPPPLPLLLHNVRILPLVRPVQYSCLDGDGEAKKPSSYLPSRVISAVLGRWRWWCSKVTLVVHTVRRLVRFGGGKEREQFSQEEEEEEREMDDPSVMPRSG